jgi:hypothetical protein
MGFVKNYEIFEDFITEAKNKGYKDVFYSMTQVSPEGSPNVVNKIVTVSAISDDGKVYLTHRKLAGTLTLSETTTQPEVDAFDAKCKKEKNDIYLTLQEKYPSADLKEGQCAPTEA